MSRPEVASGTKPVLSNVKGLAIKGGGAAGVTYLGALRGWVDAGFRLEQFTHFAGSSAGSIVATLLALRAGLDFLERKMKSTDFSKFLDTSILSKAKDVAALVERYGWNSGDGLETWIADILGELTGNPEITFAEANAKYGTRLIITTTDVLYPECKLVVLDWTSAPHMTLHAAIRRSCSIPFFFQAVFDEGRVFIDGGVMDNYPIGLLYQCLPKEQCIGLFLTSPRTKTTVVASRPVASYAEVVSSIVNTASNLMLEHYVRPDDWARTCFIPTEIKTTDFSVSLESQERAIAGALLAMQQFILATTGTS